MSYYPMTQHEVEERIKQLECDVADLKEKAELMAKALDEAVTMIRERDARIKQLERAAERAMRC